MIRLWSVALLHIAHSLASSKQFGVSLFQASLFARVRRPFLCVSVLLVMERESSPAPRSLDNEVTSPRTAEAIEILRSAGDRDAEKLALLENRRKELHKQRMTLSKEIKNEVKKRRRLLTKARGLSNDSLLEVMAARRAKSAQSKAKASANMLSEQGSR